MRGYIIIPREHLQKLKGRAVATAVYVSLLNASEFDARGRITVARMTMQELIDEVYGQQRKEYDAKRKSVARALSELEDVGLISINAEMRHRRKQIEVKFDGMSAWYGSKEEEKDVRVLSSNRPDNVRTTSVIGPDTVHDRKVVNPYKSTDVALSDFYHVHSTSVQCPDNVRDLSASCPDNVLPSYIYRDRDNRDKDTIDTETITLTSKQPPAYAGEERAPNPKDPVSSPQEHMSSLAEKELPKKETTAVKSRDETPYTEIVAAWNEMARSNGLPTVQSITESRKKVIRARFREERRDKDQDKAIDAIRAVFDRVARSDFLTGRKEGSTWCATFDWVLFPEKYTRIKEGAYDNRVEVIKQKPMPRAFEGLFELLEESRTGKEGGGLFGHDS